MRRGLGRTLARFALIFALSLAALAALWPYAASVYTSAVATVARPVFRLVEAPNATVLDVQGDELSVYRIVGEDRITPVVLFDRYLYFAVVPLLALFLATPGLGVRKRMTRTAFGLVGLFAFHVAYLVTSVELIYAVGPGHSVAGWQVAVRVLWEASPILLWAGLTAGAWKRALLNLRALGSEEAETSSTEPVGAVG